MGNTVLLEKKNSLLVVKLNRPEVGNALNITLLEELIKVMEECFEPHIRAVVLTGVGDNFCSGLDLQDMQDTGLNNLPNYLREITKMLHRIILDIRLLPKPVIAAAKGNVSNAGMSIALSCDLRYAEKETEFKQDYTSHGLVPNGGMSAFLPVIVGYSKAAELLLADPVLKVRDAEELGIIKDSFTKEEFDQRVETAAQNLAEGATFSYARSKDLLNASLMPLLERQLKLESQSLITTGATVDAIEGVSANCNRRPPVFSGN